MTRFAVCLIIASLGLSACGGGANWWGKDRSDRAPQSPSQEAVNPLIPTESTILGNRKNKNEIPYQGKPVDQISQIELLQVPGGMILRAVGASDVQGLYEVRLTAENEGAVQDGVLSYHLKARRPTRSAKSARGHVTAAVRLTDQDLQDAHTIRVSGRDNTRTIQIN